jgi:hypothetical protein
MEIDDVPKKRESYIGQLTVNGAEESGKLTAFARTGVPQTFVVSKKRPKWRN